MYEIVCGCLSAADKKLNNALNKIRRTDNTEKETTAIMGARFGGPASMVGSGGGVAAIICECRRGEERPPDGRRP
jgi:hypothetical protein